MLYNCFRNHKHSLLLYRVSKQNIIVLNDDNNATAQIKWTQQSKDIMLLWKHLCSLMMQVVILCSDIDTCMHLPAVFAPGQYTDSDLLW